MMERISRKRRMGNMFHSIPYLWVGISATGSVAALGIACPSKSRRAVRCLTYIH
jgi:hypothetical protein